MFVILYCLDTPADMPGQGHGIQTDDNVPRRLRTQGDLRDVFAMVKSYMSDTVLIQPPLLVYPTAFQSSTEILQELNWSGSAQETILKDWFLGSRANGTASYGEYSTGSRTAWTKKPLVTGCFSPQPRPGVITSVLLGTVSFGVCCTTWPCDLGLVRVLYGVSGLKLEKCWRMFRATSSFHIGSWPCACTSHHLTSTCYHMCVAP